MFPFGRSVTTPTEVRATRAMGWVRVERRLLAGRRVLLLHLLARLGEHPFDGIRLPGGTLAIGCSRDRVLLDDSADAGGAAGGGRVGVEAVQLEQLPPLLPEDLLHHAARVVPRLFESRAAELRVGLERLQIRVALGGDGRFDGLHVPILRAELEIDQGDVLRKGPAAAAALASLERVAQVSEFPSRAALTALVQGAVKLNEDGVRAEWQKAQQERRKNPVPVKPPPALAAALKKNARARKTWDAFTPSHRRDYVG